MTRRREPVLLGVYDPRGSVQPRAAFERALRPFGAVTVHERAPLTLGVAGPEPVAPGGDGLLCVVEGYVDGRPKPEEHIATLWQRAGAKLAEQLRGGFAIALWDADRQRGMLLRDQLGQRPMFLYEDGPRLYFASEVRLLLAGLARRPAPDRDAVAMWLAPSSLRENRIPYAGVRRLPNASLVELRDGRWTERRY